MNTRWPEAISRIVYWKQKAHEYDRDGLLPWHLPNVKAGSDRIAQAERKMTMLFPAAYREFLLYADGWKAFFIVTDLFGTDDFINERAEEILERRHVTNFINTNKLDKAKVLPIGASAEDENVFLVISEESEKIPGVVVWIDDREIERYKNFEEFFESMVNQHAELAGDIMSD